jgi:hypothetical protein
MEEKILRNNFEWHLNRITEGNPVDSPSFMDRFMTLDVTHTFGEYNSRGEILWKKIFMNPNIAQRGLLSHAYRELHGMENSRNPTDNVVNERLNEYVFAYLGSHEDFYAGTFENTPFGVFISIALEDFNTTDASYRDLDSPQMKCINHAFLKPADARRMIAYEINELYEGNLWYYWGSPDYISENDYKETMWTKKAEMHFFNKVDTKYIKGILWPIIPHWTEEGADIEDYISDIRLFQRYYPDIKVYSYDWSIDFGSDAFLNASYFVSHYFYIHGQYPESQKIEYEY